jgi:hypothetical protein
LQQLGLGAHAQKLVLGMASPQHIQLLGLHLKGADVVLEPD